MITIAVAVLFGKWVFESSLQGADKFGLLFLLVLVMGFHLWLDVTHLTEGHKDD